MKVRLEVTQTERIVILAALGAYKMDTTLPAIEKNFIQDLFDRIADKRATDPANDGPEVDLLREPYEAFARKMQPTLDQWYERFLGRDNE
jgi:hypothetical protein